VDLTAPEIRVLGSLIEKQRTTPDAYPLSLNSLRLACNQATSRDPVVDYDEATVRDALHRLGRRRFTRLASGAGSRAAKFRHLLDEALGLGSGEIALLAVLMLRGPQTPGELRSRSERMHRFADQDDLQAALDRLVDRTLVARQPRRPGQKEERFAHRLDEDALDAPDAAPTAAAAPAAGATARAEERHVTVAAAAPPHDGRLGRLEAEVAELRAEVAALRDALGG
jgi:uncharacterized protein YceH (UPF0502 family)